MAKQVKALARRTPAQVELASNPALMFERLAKDKNVDVGKLERLIAMQERILAVNAKTAFNSAYAAMQLALPVIEKNGSIKNRAGAVQSRYSKYEDIQRVVKPILQRFGFAIRHKTEFPQAGMVRVIGILTHVEGHAEDSAFEGPMDQSEYRTDVQSLGSTASYGRRYTVLDLLNLEQRGLDNAGQSAPSRRRDSTPAATAAPEPRPGDDTLISDPQRRRLFAITKSAGRSHDEVKAWLAVAYNIDSTKKIRRRDYEAITTAVERPGSLPAPRDVGEEG